MGVAVDFVSPFGWLRLSSLVQLCSQRVLCPRGVSRSVVHAWAGLCSSCPSGGPEGRPCPTLVCMVLHVTLGMPLATTSLRWLDADRCACLYGHPLVRDPGLVLRTACCLRMSVIDSSQPFVVRLLHGPRVLVYRPRGLLWQSHERPVRLVVKLSASDVRPPLPFPGSQGQLEAVGA